LSGVKSRRIRTLPSRLSESEFYYIRHGGDAGLLAGMVVFLCVDRMILLVGPCSPCEESSSNYHNLTKEKGVYSSNEVTRPQTFKKYKLIIVILILIEIASLRSSFGKVFKHSLVWSNHKFIKGELKCYYLKKKLKSYFKIKKTKLNFNGVIRYFDLIKLIISCFFKKNLIRFS
jgi:hypothetical protein